MLFLLLNSEDSDNQIIGIADSSGVFQKGFIYGTKSHVPDYMIMGGNKFKIITNHLGSPVVVVNSSTGVIAQEIHYDEWGKILSDTNPGFTPFGFAGCLYDQDTKLCRFGARDYDASIGRWLSKDPILFAGGDTNLYGYVMQDPINFIDPDGQSGVAIGIGVGLGVIISDLINDRFGSPNSMLGKRNDRRLDMIIPGDGKYDYLERKRNIRKGLEKYEDKYELPQNSCDLI